MVVNSCAVTQEALRQTKKAIRRARRDHPDARLLVTGCAAEIDRAVIGAMDEVDGLVANAAKLDPRAWNIATTAAPIAHAGAMARTRAFIAVQNGCDHACTFCVIPQRARGQPLGRGGRCAARGRKRTLSPGRRKSSLPGSI